MMIWCLGMSLTILTPPSSGEESFNEEIANEAEVRRREEIMVKKLYLMAGGTPVIFSPRIVGSVLKTNWKRRGWILVISIRQDIF
ncbi:unnamed protein product [Caenorhabditis bovis]|uniref:Uncharacterized protein n=1 Tax=Caenorhabditis bovis TaxID=2654633 RepID=A0A8S1EHX7_9PELO|nr:unnamed protein product [Caenorhabditis bovis]